MLTIKDLKGFFFHNYYKGFELDPSKIIKYIEEEGDENKKRLNAGGLIYEQIEVLKLQTIKRYLQLQGEQRKSYLKRITATKVKKDKLNLIKNKGVHLTSEEFKLYLELYINIKAELYDLF